MTFLGPYCPEVSAIREELMPEEGGFETQSQVTGRAIKSY